MNEIILTRKQARELIDVLNELSSGPFGTFFTNLMDALDEEQGMDPDEREGIVISVEGVDF